MESFFVGFKFLHIAMMFGAVAAAVMPEVVLHIVAGTRDTRAIATMAGIAERIGKTTPVLFVGGAIFGLLAAWSGQIDFTAPWLLATYVLFLVAMVTGITIAEPWVRRLGSAAASAEGGSAELEAVIAEPRAKIASAWLMFTVVAIIFLMVVKPGS